MGNDTSEGTRFGEIFSTSTSRSFDRGASILNEDQVPPGLFYIESGFVKSCTFSPEGERNIVIVLGPKDIFPLEWAVNSTPLDVSYCTITRAVLKMMPLSRFRVEFEHNSGFRSDVMQELMNLFHAHFERIQNLEFRRARQRIAYRLLFLGRRFGEHCGDGITLPLPVTHQDLADATAMTRETANREMLELAKQQYIRMAGTRLSILNENGLKDLLELF